MKRRVKGVEIGALQQKLSEVTVEVLAANRLQWPLHGLDILGNQGHNRQSSRKQGNVFYHSQYCIERVLVTLAACSFMPSGILGRNMLLLYRGSGAYKNLRIRVETRMTMRIRMRI